MIAVFCIEMLLLICSRHSYTHRMCLQKRLQCIILTNWRMRYMHTERQIDFV